MISLFPSCCKAAIVSGLYDLDRDMEAIKKSAATKDAPDYKPDNFNINKTYFAISSATQEDNKNYLGKPTPVDLLKKHGWTPVARLSGHAGYAKSILWMYPPPETKEAREALEFAPNTDIQMLSDGMMAIRAKKPSKLLKARVKVRKFIRRKNKTAA